MKIWHKRTILLTRDGKLTRRCAGCWPSLDALVSQWLAQSGREDDVYRIVFVTRLRATGMPITQIQRYAILAQQGDTTVVERLELLEAHRAAVAQKLEELQEHLALIRGKIAHYQESYRKELRASRSEM